MNPVKLIQHFIEIFSAVMLVLIFFFVSSCKTCNCPAYSLNKKGKQPLNKETTGYQEEMIETKISRDTIPLNTHGNKTSRNHIMNYQTAQ